MSCGAHLVQQVSQILSLNTKRSHVVSFMTWTPLCAG